MIFKSKVDEANYVVNWHLFSDKTTDKKQSTMSLEEAELIIFNSENNK